MDIANTYTRDILQYRYCNWQIDVYRHRHTRENTRVPSPVYCRWDPRPATHTATPPRPPMNGPACTSRDGRGPLLGGIDTCTQTTWVKVQSKGKRTQSARSRPLVNWSRVTNVYTPVRTLEYECVWTRHLVYCHCACTDFCVHKNVSFFFTVLQLSCFRIPLFSSKFKVCCVLGVRLLAGTAWVYVDVHVWPQVNLQATRKQKSETNKQTTTTTTTTENSQLYTLHVRTQCREAEAEAAGEAGAEAAAAEGENGILPRFPTLLVGQ